MIAPTYRIAHAGGSSGTRKITRAAAETMRRLLGEEEGTEMSADEVLTVLEPLLTALKSSKQQSAGHPWWEREGLASIIDRAIADTKSLARKAQRHKENTL
jgi:hypothetical protein